MNWETIATVLGAMGGLEFLKWLFTHKSVRRMASAQASGEETNAAASREKLYEDTILFLQMHGPFGTAPVPPGTGNDFPG